MKILFLLLLAFGLSLSADTTRVLRINAEVQGAWDYGEWFTDELESSMQGFQNFQVIPRVQIAKMLAGAPLDPQRRNIAVEQLVDSLFPANFRMNLRVSAPNIKESRTPVLFWLGRRVVRMEAALHLYAKDSSISELRGDLVVDTTLSAGYCGMLDCNVRPMEMKQRQEIEKLLFRRLIQLIRERMDQLLVIPVVHKAKMDSLHRADSLQALLPSSTLATSSGASPLSSSSNSSSSAATKAP